MTLGLALNLLDLRGVDGGGVICLLDDGSSSVIGRGCAPELNLLLCEFLSLYRLGVGLDCIGLSGWVIDLC